MLSSFFDAKIISMIFCLFAYVLLKGSSERPSIHRGYYIAMGRYQTQEEKFHISKQLCNVLLINKCEIPNYFTLKYFAAKGAIFHVAMAMVIFLSVKIL